MIKRTQREFLIVKLHKNEGVPNGHTLIQFKTPYFECLYFLNSLARYPILATYPDTHL